MILRFLKIILIVAVILVITISIILLLLSMQPFVPNNYTQIVKTGGELEAKYLAMGASQVEHKDEKSLFDLAAKLHRILMISVFLRFSF